MIRIIRHWLEVKRLAIQLEARLYSRRVARKVNNARARRAAQTKLESTIAQQKRFFGLGA